MTRKPPMSQLGPQGHSTTQVEDGSSAAGQPKFGAAAHRILNHASRVMLQDAVPALVGSRLTASVLPELLSVLRTIHDSARDPQDPACPLHSRGEAPSVTPL